MLSKFWHYLCASVAVVGTVVGSPAWATTYNFDNYITATNDFSISSGGQTATFSSSSGPGTLVVALSSDFFTFPVAFGGFGNFMGDPLTITFTDPAVDRILIPFGVFEAFATAPVTLVATSNTGQAVPFTTTSFNNVSFSPEGLVDFVPVGAISSLTLTSSMAFAIASVDVSSNPGGGVTVDVPAPMSATLLGSGLVIVALTRRRRAMGQRSN